MSVFSNPGDSTPDQTRAYIDAILELLGDRDPMAVLRSTPDALREAVDDTPASLLTVPEADGKWSVADVVHHLADSEIMWSVRLRKALAEDRPPLPGFDQDRWAKALGYGKRDPGPSLEAFLAVRRANTALIEALGEEALGRVGIHRERGEESVGHMMRLYAGHDLLHLRQIQRIRGAVG